MPVQKAANRFIKKLARGDRARIGFFHERVVLGPRFTDDMKEHSAMINQMRPQRATHLYDALVESLEMLESVPKRKALLVFSDGEDQGSRRARPRVLDRALHLLHDERGTSLLESVIVIPVLLAIGLGVFEFGKTYW